MASKNQSSLSTLLEKQWAQPGSTLAERSAWVGKAFCALDPSQHAGWGSRLAQCLIDYHAGGSPFLPEPQRLSPELHDTVSSNLCHSMSWGLLEVALSHASADALLSAFLSLPAPNTNAITNHPAKFADAIFSGTLAKLSASSRFDDIAQMIGSAAEVTTYRIDDLLLSPKASALSHPVILKSAIESFAKYEAESERQFYSTSKRPRAERFKLSYFTSGNKDWLKALAGMFESEKPTRGDIENLNLCTRKASLASRMTPELAQERKASDKSKNLRGRSYKSFVDAERSEAAKAAVFFREARDLALAKMAKIDPASAARIVMSMGQPSESLESTWNGCGLSSVPADGFLLDPWITSSHGVSAPRERQAIWPMFADAPTRSALFEVQLNYLDCAALSGAARETLQAEADRGARPSAGLSQALGTPGIERKLSESEALWLASFSGNSQPMAKKRILKA